MEKTKLNIFSFIRIFPIILLIIILNACSGSDTHIASSSSTSAAFINGIDENTYLARMSGNTYSDSGTAIPSGNLPYKYFASRGINYARIRVWVGSGTSGNYANALANGLAAKEAGLRTLLVIFLSEEWSDNISCSSEKVGSIFRDLTFEQKKPAVYNYCKQLVKDFNDSGIYFSLYAVGNEVYNCLCGESSKNNMVELLHTSYDAIRSEDTDAKFIFHIPHAAPADALNYFDEMINTYGLACDYLSTSFYPLQHGADAFNDYRGMVSDLYSAHGKPFIISEWSYPDSELPANSFWIDQGIMDNVPVTGYMLTPQGQSNLVRDLLQWGKASSEVAGIFYWGPMFNLEDESAGILYGWLWLSIFDINGDVKQAVNSLQ